MFIMMKRNMIKYPLENTRTKILNEMLSRDLTAINLVDILEINESAVRRHLNKLENEGFVESYFEKADKGRPKKFFTITDEGEELFPKETELILNTLIKNMKDQLGKETLEEFSDLVVEDLKEYFPEIEEEEDLENKIAKVVNASDELGFYSSYDRENDHYSIVYENCVFGDLPQEQAAWLCKIHVKIIDDLLGEVDIEQKKSMLEGDKVCLQKIGE